MHVAVHAKDAGPGEHDGAGLAPAVEPEVERLLLREREDVVVEGIVIGERDGGADRHDQDVRGERLVGRGDLAPAMGAGGVAAPSSQTTACPTSSRRAIALVEQGQAAPHVACTLRREGRREEAAIATQPDQSAEPRAMLYFGRHVPKVTVGSEGVNADRRRRRCMTRIILLVLLAFVPAARLAAQHPGIQAQRRTA